MREVQGRVAETGVYRVSALRARIPRRVLEEATAVLSFRRVEVSDVR